MITEPGIYDIPNSTYHSQCCDRPSVSSTGLRLIRSKSPAHFWAQSDLNPAAAPKEKTKALSFGSAAHALLLEGDLPEDEYAIEEFVHGYAKNEDGWKAGDKRKWKADREAEGLIVVSHADLEKIREMADALGRHHLIRDGLFRGEIERSVFWTDPDFPNIWLKARPDVIPQDTMLAEYKTAASCAPRDVNREIWKRGYHMQVAMAADGIREATGREIEHVALVVQEKEPPFDVSLYSLSAECLDAGRAEYRGALKKFATCLLNNQWAGWGDHDVILPSWKQKELETEGLL